MPVETLQLISLGQKSTYKEKHSCMYICEGLVLLHDWCNNYVLFASML